MKLTSIAAALGITLPAYTQNAQSAQKTIVESNSNQQQAANETVEPANDKTTQPLDEIDFIQVGGVHLADLKAHALERSSDSYSLVIATDDLGSFVVQNVAESLRLLPRVTLEREVGEGTKVSIRGIGPNFVNISINGGEMADTNDKPRVSFQKDNKQKPVISLAQPNKLLSRNKQFVRYAPSTSTSNCKVFAQRGI
jgi:iron complex outermembrane recepter protein